MRHFLDILVYILKNKSQNRFTLFVGYLKIIFGAYFYHKIQQHFYRQQPDFFSIVLMGLKIKFFNHAALLHLFEEIFICEIYLFETLTGNPSIVDCGSNIGLSVLYFKKKFPESTVLAFEPDENNFHLLEKNVTDNQLNGVTLKKIALTTHKSEKRFFTTDCKTGSLNNSLIQSSIHTASITIKTERLSQFIFEKVDWLKIDTEGAEGDIIQDICFTDKIKFIDQLFIEYHKQCALSLSDLEELLARYNFKRMVLLKSNYLHFKKINVN